MFDTYRDEDRYILLLKWWVAVVLDDATNTAAVNEGKRILRVTLSYLRKIGDFTTGDYHVTYADNRATIRKGDHFITIQLENPS